jgi:hypothetical protein
MPTTKAGAKVKKSLVQEYGAKKGERIYYALQVKGKGGKGKHKWEGAGGRGRGRLAKAKRSYAKKHKNAYGK